jgi:hypothetical protein
MTIDRTRLVTRKCSFPSALLALRLTCVHQIQETKVLFAPTFPRNTLAPSARYYVPEDQYRHLHRRENFKYHIEVVTVHKSFTLPISYPWHSYSFASTSSPLESDYDGEVRFKNSCMLNEVKRTFGHDPRRISTLASSGYIYVFMIHVNIILPFSFSIFQLIAFRKVLRPKSSLRPSICLGNDELLPASEQS